MKTIRRVLFGMLIAVPMFLAPQQSRAGGLDDLLNGLLGGGGSDSGNGCGCQTPPPPPNGGGGNSVPIDGGTVFLLVAGLGLGARLMYQRSKQLQNSMA